MTFSIWIKATLRVMNGRLLPTRLPLYSTPIGTRAWRYSRPVILNFLQPSSILVVQARICVIMEAKTTKTRCQHVNVTAVSGGLISEPALGKVRRMGLSTVVWERESAKISGIGF